jgi:eukaryotic-like serine/threonine-protein kinase
VVPAARLESFPSVETEAALAFAMAGDTARAESLAQDLGKRFPLDTQMQSLWLPAFQAQLANNLSCLYRVYVRGEAYLAAGQGSAAAEFQKILDHNGIVWNRWTGALAHLGVARANALEARTSQGADADAARVRALAAYKDFLTLWKDADPDIAILIAAKSGKRLEHFRPLAAGYRPDAMERNLFINLFSVLKNLAPDVVPFVAVSTHPKGQFHHRV